MKEVSGLGIHSINLYKRTGMPSVNGEFDTHVPVHRYVVHMNV